MRLDDATGQVRMISQLDNITVDARGLVQHFEALRCFFGELLGDVVSHAVLSCPPQSDSAFLRLQGMPPMLTTRTKWSLPELCTNSAASTAVDNDSHRLGKYQCGSE